MYPRDNIFNIYYNIGKRLPFLVKRCRPGSLCCKDEATMYSLAGRSFLVERIQPRGQYGKAYGRCFVDGEPNDEYRKQCYPHILNDEIPCAGCGEWVLLDVPGVDMNEIFPIRQPDFVLAFGKYKGKTLGEIYKMDAQYISWLMKQDHYFRVDLDALSNTNVSNAENAL